MAHRVALRCLRTPPLDSFTFASSSSLTGPPASSSTMIDSYLPGTSSDAHRCMVAAMRVPAEEGQGFDARWPRRCPQ